MTAAPPPRFELFLPCSPGLEPILQDEVRALGWSAAKAGPGGVTLSGSWPDIWRANLLVRGANRVLVRIGSFRAPSLHVLHGKVCELPVLSFLKHGQPFRVEAVCRRSKIFHSGAAEERVAKAVMTTTGAEVSHEEGLKLFVRIDSNHCTVSIDSSGDLLHRRGFKRNVAGAPIRETMASLFLRACSFTGVEPVFDPLCGSGTIPIEAAEIAAGLAPGRARSFAFEHFASFRPDTYARTRSKALGQTKPTTVRFYGADKAEGAIAASKENAARAGVSEITSFEVSNLSGQRPPEGGSGLVLANPPYGSRLGDRAALGKLYATLGSVLRQHFAGWRVGIVTSDDRLAKATGLSLEPGPPVPHGGLKVRLWQTQL